MTEYVRKDDKEIEELKEMIKNHMSEEDNQIKELISEVKLLREEVRPVLDIYTNSRGFFNTVTFILKYSAIIGAGVGAIMFLKKL